MNGVASISGSALQAFSLAQQVTANNIANISTESFKGAKADFRSEQGGGVSATASATGDSVDISKEAVNLLSNANGFKANLKVIETANEMTKELFSIKA